MISAIILTWNSEKYIESCIRSLAVSAETAGERLEIIVIDNGSHDATITVLEDLKKEFLVEIIALSENKGTTYSRNLGIKKATGDQILILDSDVEVRKDLLQKLLIELRSNPEVGLIAPQLIYPDGETQMSWKRFPTVVTKVLKPLGSHMHLFKKLAERDELYQDSEGKVSVEKTYPDYCISACWLVRKEVFDRVGLLDEHIFYSPEDVDFCLRVWQAGYKIEYFPSAVAVHHTQRISYTNKKIALSHLKGLIYFFKKHGYWFRRPTIDKWKV